MVAASVETCDADALLLFHAEDSAFDAPLAAVDQATQGALRELTDGGDFVGKTGEVTVIYPRGALRTRRVIVSGTGKADALDMEALRCAAANGIRRARDLKVQRLAIVPPVIAGVHPAASAQAVTEGALLGAYKYQGQKHEEEAPPLPTALEVLATAPEQEPELRSTVETASAFATGSITARDLVNLPPNICTPIYLASVARNIADRNNMKVEVLDRAQMEALSMGALLAVAQGSDTPPRFIVLEHNPDMAQARNTVVLVGKGVTFDTGGYSIKTSEGMVGMKADMAGAAAVIGAMQTIAVLKVPLHVVGLIPAADNMISGKAFRPQEVVTASNNKTIEIVSTDAEGRMLLADALVYASRYEPAAVIDIATLTGACVVALGNAAAGYFCTDDRLRDQLNTAAELTGERLWQLPLFADYKKQIESDTADMKNAGGRGGGACTAAVFLQEFVSYPAWAHIDMAGMMGDQPNIAYVPTKGASGYGARLLAEFARRWAGAGDDR